MQIILDVKPNYYEQIMGVLQSLDPHFFNKIETDENSVYSQNKKYLMKELDEIDSNKVTLVSEEEFWTSTDEVLSNLK
jgi:hypothetical protein